MRHPENWRFARGNNAAVPHTTGRHLVFLNNDVEVIAPDWLDELAGHALRPHVGAVGAMLYYPDDTIQHAGVVTGVHGVAAHPYSGKPRGYPGQMARARLGVRAIIGVSCYDSLERARHYAAAGADYLAFGAFFASPTKPHARVATPRLLREAKAFGLPLVAIGGITHDNAPGLIDAGADAVAVISALFGARDVRAAARRFSDLFESDPSRR